VGLAAKCFSLHHTKSSFQGRERKRKQTEAEREREAASPPGRQAGRRRRQRRGEESERERGTRNKDHVCHNSITSLLGWPAV